MDGPRAAKLCLLATARCTRKALNPCNPPEREMRVYCGQETHTQLVQPQPNTR